MATTLQTSGLLGCLLSVIIPGCSSQRGLATLVGLVQEKPTLEGFQEPLRLDS